MNLRLTLGAALKSWKLKGRHREAGLDIAIENPKGDVRHWYNRETDERGQTVMEYPYGYIRHSWGMDSEEVDVFVGDLPFAEHEVHVVTTKRAPDFIVDDEQKCFLGFPSRAVAKQVFLRHYQSPRFFGSIASMSFEDFKRQVLQGPPTSGGAVVGKGLVKGHVRGGHLVKPYLRSQAFRDWFEGSQAVDKHGRPLTLYHGTRGNFSAFDIGHEGTNSNVFGSWGVKRAAAFFATDPAEAARFTDQGGDTDGANVMPVHLYVAAPLDLRRGWSGLSDGFYNAIEEHGIRARSLINRTNVWSAFDEESGGRELVAALKAMDYDGVVMNADEGDGDAWGVFDANQIKSALGNRGTFDPEDPDITKATEVKAYTRKGKPVRGYRQQRKQRRQQGGVPSGPYARDKDFDAMIERLNAEQDHVKALSAREREEQAKKPQHERYAATRKEAKPEESAKKPDPSFKPSSAALRWAQQAGEKLDAKPAEQSDATPLPHVGRDDWFQRKTDITDALEANGFALSDDYQAGDSEETYEREVDDDTAAGVTYGPGGTKTQRVVIGRKGWRVGSDAGTDTQYLAEMLKLPVEGPPADFDPAIDAASTDVREDMAATARANTQTTAERDWEGTRPPDDYEDLDNDDNSPPSMSRGWIDPGGHYHDIGRGQAYWHLDWLRHQGYVKSRADNYVHMLQAGWIRTYDSGTYEVGSEDDFKRVAAFAKDRYHLPDGSQISVDVTTPVREGEKAKTTNRGQGDSRVESVLVCVDHGREECPQCTRLDRGRLGAAAMKATTQWADGYGDALRGADPQSQHAFYVRGYAAAKALAAEVLPLVLPLVPWPEQECATCGFTSGGDVCDVCGAEFAEKATKPKFDCGKGGIKPDLHGLRQLDEVIRLVRGAVGRDGVVGARVTPEPEIAIVCGDAQKIERVQKELQRLPDLCDPEHRSDPLGVMGYHCSIKGVPLVLRTERIQRHAVEAKAMDDGTPETRSYLAELGKHHELADHGIASRRPQQPVRRQTA